MAVARIVCVHGIAQQYKGERTALVEWLPALQDGVRRARGDQLADSLTENDVKMAFYGDIFRPGDDELSAGEPLVTAADLTDYERSLLFAWWQEAAATDQSVDPPEDDAALGTPATVQHALRALSRSKYFAGLAPRLMFGSLVQVRRYFDESTVRARIAARIADRIDPDTEVIVAHSLGSVAAYEALMAHPEWSIRRLVTLGSPLGIQNLVFERLLPEPQRLGKQRRGHWPAGLDSWHNVTDRGDVVALVKDLRPLFDQRMEWKPIDNGVRAHDVARYLTAKATGESIAGGMSDAV